ncbi:molybdopterin oxidoreductase [Streptomyces sp. NE5-10]|uniref:molybdopterin-dependent oxidoreductase n=1 Tax=Streptomyces sp. NE5-10 TaxID=2759674 RepID=UPI001A5A76AE|nr:molybdopterin-dependent oxidoreductase [Streptomyces sp. NE5-10]GHJ97893.1 molybdopterin oxidoreductase [Streptomyces sp. NE5-10]
MIQEKRGFCTLCKSRCGAVFTIDDGRLIGARPDPDHPTGAAMCPKGRSAPEITHSTHRLTSPLRRTHPKSDPDPGWVPVSWEEAMAEIAEKLTAVAAQNGPEAVAFAVATPSGTMVSDATEWIERFVRLFGSPNTVYSAEICNWHKDFAHAFTFGGPIPPPDYAHADLALLWGFNPAKTWLAQSAALSAAQAKGTRLAVVDPRRSTTALRADRWLRVRPGTDAALALGLAHLLISSGRYDEAFVRAWTNAPLLVRSDNGRFLRANELAGACADPADAGFAVFDEEAEQVEPYATTHAARRPERFALRGTRDVPLRDGSVVTCEPAFERYADACAAWTPDRVSAATWIPEREVRALADDIAAASSVTYYGWTGVGQSTNATQTERALATLYALTGSYDTPGGNHVVPAPAHNPASFPGQIDPAQRAKALGLAEHPLGPQTTGYINSGDLCTAVETGRPYPVRALIGFGSNLVVSQPDSDRTARALAGLDFQVHLDLFHNPTSTTADLVLPVSSAYEHEALRFGFEVSHRAQEHVQLRPRMVEPQGEARSDTEVVFDLACRLGMGADFFDGDIEAAWNWQLEPLGLTTDELRRSPGGVRIPREPANRKYAAPATGPDLGGTVTGFATPTRRVELYSERLLEHGYPPVPEHRDPAPTDAAYPLVLTCAKHGYFVHSQHRSVTSLRRRATAPSIDIHPRTAAAHGISVGQWVEVATRLGAIRLRARLDDSLHPSVVVGEYGWWQDAPDLALPGAAPTDETGSNYNRLVGHALTDPLSGSAPLRSAACRITSVTGTTSRAGTRVFTVTSSTETSPGVRTLGLAPQDGGRLPDYRPGQHLTVRAENRDGTSQDPAQGRSYSLVGPALDTDRRDYRIAVRKIPDGAFSTWLHEEAAVGDRLHVTSPGGVFAIPTHTDHPVVLLAGGIGITPFLSYLETLAATGGTVPEVVLHYGNRNSTDHPFKGRLRELARLITALRIVDHYAAPAATDTLGRDYDREGFIGVDDIDPALFERRARFYMCGPQPMMDALTDALIGRGVPPFEVFSEKFRPLRKDVAVPDGAEYTVTFARSGRSARWRKGDGVLLALGEAVGVDMPSGCRVGQCESCACTVLKGTAAHLVPPSEDLPESEVLTCQSLPTSDLVLDA